MKQELNKVIVHLIHGTWAKKSNGSKPAWFERESSTYNLLKNQLPSDAEIKAFLWSGRNNFESRTSASSEFASYLKKEIHDYPSSKHYIVAHSHGGTVAVEALLKTPENISCVKGLICLATPFTYKKNASIDTLKTNSTAVCAIFAAAIWYWITINFISTVRSSWTNTFFFVLLTFIASKIIFLILIKIFHKSMICDQYIFLKLEHKLPPVHLLRATRDEASLALTFMQIFQIVSSRFGWYTHSPLSNKKIIDIISFAIIDLLCGFFAIIAYDLMQFEILFDFHFASSLFIFSSAIAAFIHVLGYALLAISVGHMEINQWFTSTIEIETTPPNIFSNTKNYSELKKSFTNFRHYIYEHDEVIKDIGEIISKSNTEEATKLASELQ